MSLKKIMCLIDHYGGYTPESFLYRLMNKALRVQNIDLLFLFRFFIRDIGEQLNKYRCSSPIRLYRGQLMSNEELKVLKDSMGELISVNSFLSTSTNRQLALSVLESSTVSNDLQRVSFEIDADPRSNDVKPFANSTSFSYFSSKDKVLMMLGSIFRFDTIYHDDSRVWIIRMTLCGAGDHNLQSIFDYLKAGLETKETGLYSFGQVLHDVGKLDAAEKYIHRFLNQLPRNHKDIGLCCHALDVIIEEKGDYDSSLQWHQKSLEMWTRTLRSKDSVLGDTHNYIAVVHQKKVDYKRALESYEREYRTRVRVVGVGRECVRECWI